MVYLGEGSNDNYFFKSFMESFFPTYLVMNRSVLLKIKQLITTDKGGKLFELEYFAATVEKKKKIEKLIQENEKIKNA